MKKTILLFLAIAVLSASSHVLGAEKKIRIAVIGFEEKSAGHMSGRVGKAAEDWFTNALVNTKKFSVMEREKLQSILKEQSFQMSGAVDQLSAVKAGKMLGVQLVVFGNIDFSQKEDEVKSSGLTLGGVRLPWGGGSKKTSEGNLTTRLVNVQSGEIVHSGSETVSDSSFNVSIMGTGGGSKWDKTKTKKVFKPAVKKLVKQMVAKVDDIGDSLGSAATGSQGKVVRIKGGKVYVNLGKIDGVKAGDSFGIYRGEEIVDPDTGQVLGRDETEIATIKIDKVMGDHLAAGKVSGKGKPEKGDVVKK